MKILVVVKRYPPEIGGIEVTAQEINRIAKKMGNDVTVLTFNNSGSYFKNIFDGVKVVRLPVFVEKGSIRLSWKYKKEYSKLEKNVDLVLFHFPVGQPEIDFFFRKAKKNKKYICLYHSDIVGRGIIGDLYNKIIVKKFLPKMDRIIATSPNIIETSPLLEKNQDKTTIIPLFVDTEHFYFREDNKRKYLLNLIKAELSNPKIVLYVGRFGRYKGLDYFIRAIKLLPSNYLGVLIGDGPKRKEIQSLISTEKLQNKILLLNHVSYDDLPKYYSAADVFVLPSTDRGEAFGLVAIEAMACGIPIITTELGTGTSYHNVDKVTGRVVEPKNSQQIADAILEITNSKKYNREIVRKRAEDFSAKAFEDRWTKLLRKFGESK